MVTSELETTWRVYVREWLLDSRHLSERAAHDHMLREYAGRLNGTDMYVTQDIEGDDVTWLVKTRRWNVDSEFKREKAAKRYAKALAEDRCLYSDDVMVVARNSRDEHVLRQYGILLLPESV